MATIISYMLIFTISFIVVIASYLWGKPLIDKGVSKINLENGIEFANYINEEIKAVATSGGSRVFDVSIRDWIGKIDDDAFYFSITSTVPIVSAISYIPINSYTEPIKEETFTYTLRDNESEVYLPSGASSDVKVTYDDVYLDTSYKEKYYILIYDKNNDGAYDYLCIGSNTSSPISCNSLGKNITIEGTTYTIQSLSSSQATLKGYLKRAVYQGDEYGIIQMKGSKGGKQKITFKLTYIPVIDESGREMEIRLFCNNNCFGSGNKKLFIKKDREEYKGDKVIIYVEGKFI